MYHIDFMVRYTCNNITSYNIIMDESDKVKEVCEFVTQRRFIEPTYTSLAPGVFMEVGYPDRIDYITSPFNDSSRAYPVKIKLTLSSSNQYPNMILWVKLPQNAFDSYYESLITPVEQTHTFPFFVL